MKRAIYLFYFTILLSSCSHQEQTKYFWVRFRGHDFHKSDTIQLTTYSIIDKKDSTIINCENEYEQLSYFVINSNDTSFIFLGPKNNIHQTKDSILFIRNFFDTIISFNKDSFRVKKFILDEFVTDGSSIYYFTPSLGIYAEHSGTWPGLKYLQTNDSLLNKKINFLIKATVPDFFVSDMFEKKSPY